MTPNRFPGYAAVTAQPRTEMTRPACPPGLAHSSLPP